MRGLLLLAAFLLAAPVLAEGPVVGDAAEDGPMSPLVETPPVTVEIPVPPSAADEAKPIGLPSAGKGETPVSGKDESPWKAAQGVAACLVVGLLLGLGVWMLKRAFPSRLPAGSGTLMEVLARTPVGPKQSVVLLRVAGRVLVVGVGPEHLTTLSEISDAGEVEKLLLQPAKAPAGDFRSRLAGVLSPLRGAPMGAFGEAGTQDQEKDAMAGEIRALERKVAGWRLEDGARE